MTEEQKEQLQEQDNQAGNNENKEIPIADTGNPADENNAESTKEQADTAEKEAHKSWFEKLFQSNPSKLKEQMDELTAKNEELKDKYLRLFADFDNYKKRMAKERLELMDSAGKDIIKSVLPVIDDFERAQKALQNSDDVSALKEGLDLVYQKLFKTLESKGLKPMESNGKEFDADLHEAITEIPAPSDDMKGKVIDTVEKGYYLSDKILRHAKVVVGK
jgi:molecular chaperone GrpE